MRLDAARQTILTAGGVIRQELAEKRETSVTLVVMSPPRASAAETPDHHESSRVERLIAQLPEPARPHVRESVARLSSVRTPGQAMQAFSDEVEHLALLV